MESEGKIDGVHATFTYDGKTFEARFKSRKDVTIIKRDCIIGFLPPLQQESSTEHVLLYVEVAEAKDDAAKDGQSTPVEARTMFRSMKIIDPPGRMLRDFAPSNLSWLLSRVTDPKPPQDAPETWHRVTVIISTGSGSHSAEAVFKNLLEPFLAALYPPSDQTPYHILRTTSAETITTHALTTILPAARAGRPQAILLLTGDGGPVDILNALLSPTTTPTVSAAPAAPHYAKPTLALLPCGTGNALAHSTRVAATARQTLGLAALLRGRPTPLPLFRAALPPGSFALDAHGQRAAGPAAPRAQPLHVRGAVVFSWCLHASLVADSDTAAYRAHGAARFQMAAKENLFPAGGGAPHVYRGKVEVCGGGGGGGWRKVGDEHSYVLVALVSNLEERFCVSPASRAMDGKLRLVRLPPMGDGGAGVMRVMEAAYQAGAHVGMADVTYEEVAMLRLRIEEREERWRRVCVDGKIFVVAADGEVLVEREEVDVVDLVTVFEDGRGEGGSG